MWYNCGGIGRERGGALNKRMRAELLDWGKILAGLFLSAMAYRLFLIPNQVAPGGFTGVGQILHELDGISALWCWRSTFPSALSLKSIGWRFGAKSLLASFAFSMLVDYLPVGALTDDALLAAVFGGAIGGAGFGLIMLGGATTGGSDMLGMLIHKRLKVIKVSAAVFMVDGLVILAAGIVYDVRGAMLALIATFIMARVLDRVLEGPSMAKAYFIISTKYEEIAGAVLSQMDRGVTSLSARGMFTGRSGRCCCASSTGGRRCACARWSAASIPTPS